MEANIILPRSSDICNLLGLCCDEAKDRQRSGEILSQTSYHEFVTRDEEDDDDDETCKSPIVTIIG